MNGAAPKWFTRAYRQGDEEGIFDLWKAVYPEKAYDREQWLRWWHWLYRGNPAGLGVICVAEDDGRIVGHAGEIPLAIKVGGATILAGLGIDAMTHPDYRRQGMYLAIVKTRRALGEARGIQATYAFPNELSYPGQTRELGAFDIAAMQKVVRPLNWRNAVRAQTGSRLLGAISPSAGALLDAIFFRPVKVPPLERLRFVPVSTFDQRVDDLWARASSQHQVLVVRRRDYLNWRFASIPDVDYLICVAERGEVVAGYVVISRKHLQQARIGVIMDVFAESEQVARCLIAETVTRCRREGLDLLYGARMAGTSLAAAFRRSGFLPAPFLKPIRVTGRSVSADIASQLQNPGNWFLQIGDSDET